MSSKVSFGLNSERSSTLLEISANASRIRLSKLYEIAVQCMLHEHKKKRNLCVLLNGRQVRSLARIHEGVLEEVGERGVGVHHQKFNRSCDRHRASVPSPSRRQRARHCDHRFRDGLRLLVLPRLPRLLPELCRSGPCTVMTIIRGNGRILASR